MLLCQFLVLAGNLTTGKKSSSRKKKILVICLAGARSLLRQEKKSSSRLSGGCAIVNTTGKYSSSTEFLKTFPAANALTSEVLVVCLAGCAVVSVFGYGGK